MWSCSSTRTGTTPLPAPYGDSPKHPEGHGVARRAPKDNDIPEIGDEVAAARALHALADALLHTASDDIEAVVHEPVHLDFTGPMSVHHS